MSADGLPLIIRTKLNRPLVARDLIPRTKLLNRLTDGRFRPLTLVIAPAGYGKSTLLSSWLQTMSDQPHAWLSLEENDDRLDVFVTYLVAALQTMFPRAGQNTLSLLSQNENVPLPVLVATLINELNEIEGNYVLVIDDYHFVRDPDIVQFMVDLVTHAPPSLHLALASRSDPRLPVVQFRARGQLTEIRAFDLRFSVAEAEDFLRTSLGDSLEDGVVRNVYDRSEGWVTGLRLAAISMRQLDNPEEYALTLPNAGRLVSDYLMSEALSAQSEIIQSWLLKAALFDRFCPDLCDAVFFGEDDATLASKHSAPYIDGRTFIKYLVENNIFITSLDNEGYWYRFHQLFEQFLRQESERRIRSQKLAQIHIQAANWLAANQYIEESLHHYLAAGAVDDAANVVEQNARSLLDDDKWRALENWMAQLPESIVQRRPLLQIAKAWEAFHQLDLQGILAILQTVEPLLESDETPPSIWGEVDFFWGHHWYWQGEQQLSLAHLQRALDKIPKTHHLARGEAELFWALAKQMVGRKTESLKQVNEWLYLEGELHPGRYTKLMGALIFVHLLAGELEGAKAVAQQLHEAVTESRNSYVEAWTVYLMGLVQYYRNDMVNAARYFTRVAENRYFLHKAAAVDAMAGRVFAYQGLDQPDAADEAVLELQRFAWETQNPVLIARAHSALAHLSVLQGDPAKALEQLQAVDLTAETGIMFYFLETARLTQVRAKIAVGTSSSISEADRLLEQYFASESKNHNVLKLTEILVLQSASFHKQRRLKAALLALEQAVLLASAGGYTRPFFEAGSDLQELILSLPRHDSTASFVNALQEEFLQRHNLAQQEVNAPLQATDSFYYEKLTSREREVLVLLSQDLSNQDIARELTISLNTVKRHTGNLYRKLEVSNRRQAVAKARRAGLFS